MEDFLEFMKFVGIFLLVLFAIGAPLIYFVNAESCKHFNAISGKNISKTDYFFTSGNLKIVYVKQETK